MIIGTDGARRSLFCTGVKTSVCAETPVHTAPNAKRDKIFFIFFSDLREILLSISWGRQEPDESYPNDVVDD